MAIRSYRTLPTGLKGLNLVVNPTQITASQSTVSGSAWEEFWAEFDWSGPTGIKFQIDLAKSLGCNFIRIIGNGGSGVFTGRFTLADYLAKLQTVLRYCESQGLWYYLTLGGQNEYEGYQTAPGGDGTPGGFGAITSFAGACMTAARSFGNLLAVDLCQEFYNVARPHPDGGMDKAGNALNSTQLRAFLTALVAAGRTAAPDVALTCSGTNFTGQGPAAWWTDPNFVGQCDLFDFIDMHLYGQVGVTDAQAGMSQAGMIGKQVLSGEGGGNQGQGEGTLEAIYSAIHTNFALASNLPGGSQVAGWALWAAIPQSTSPGGDYGLSDASGNLRPNGSYFGTLGSGLPFSPRRHH